MKVVYLAAICAALAIAGCKKPAEVTVDNQGNNVKTTINGKDGQLTVEGNQKEGTSKITATDKDGNKTTYESKSGIDLTAYGLDVYPGAKLKDDKNASAEVKSDKGTIATATYLSPDEPKKIAEYYKGQLTDPKENDMEDMAHLTGKTKDGAEVIVTAAFDKEKKETTISILITKKS